MKGRTAIIFYILSVYVVVQFIWWGYHLIELTNELNKESELIAKRVTMIIGEGAVFLLLLLVGIWQIRRSIRKELALSDRQKNFLLSVTHELKTPLAANKLYLQTIEKRDLNEEQRNELLAKAIEENVRLERMIDNILNASRLENNVLTPDKEEFDLEQMISGIKNRFEAVWKSSRIEVHCEKGLQITTDRFMLETIISNLVENALKYGGDKPVEIYARRENNRYVLGVKDQGKGIDKQFKADVFKKFYRIGNEETRTQKGTGLGLYIVNQLVRMLNGNIQCRDNEPMGSDFQITL